MNTTLSPLRKAKGSVLVITALALVLLVAMAGLAIDLSHAYTNKTRLQNLADALALSAAISLNKQESSTEIPDKEAYAQNFATVNTFPDFVAGAGNKEVQDSLANADLTYTFATDWSTTKSNWLAANAINGAKFARVTVNGANNWKIATWFAGVLNFNDMAVSASAVAGTTPMNPCDDVLPIMMCAETNNPNAPADAEGTRTDKNCNDDNDNSGFNDGGNKDCYGYERDVVYEAKYGNWSEKNPVIGPGNFGYFDVGSGGSAIKDCLAGEDDCTEKLCPLLNNPDPVLSSEPGNKVGPGEQGLNTRFDDYKGSVKYPDYLPDSIVNHSLSTTGRVFGHEFDPNPPYNYTLNSSQTYTQIYNSYYKNNYLTSNDLTSGHSFIPGRRKVVMPFVACPGNTNGKKELEIVGFGCFFLTSPSDGKSIYAEFLGTDGCDVSGKTTSANNFDFYKVQLYKDPFGGHS